MVIGVIAYWPARNCRIDDNEIERDIPCESHRLGSGPGDDE
jgi:hypothetical protein